MTKGHLRPEQADTIQAYIDDLKSRMGLTHWDIFVAVKPAPKGAYAAVHPVDGRQVAPVFLCRGWWDRSADDKRNDLVHELLHVIHRDQADVIRRGVIGSGYLPRKAQDLVWPPFNDHTERMVDHLAGVLAPFMPEFPDSA